MPRTGIASYLSYSMGWNRHRSIQIQRKGKDTHFYGKGIKEFVAIFRLLYMFKPGASLFSPGASDGKASVCNTGDPVVSWGEITHWFFKKIPLLGYNLHTIQFTHLKCTSQCFLIYSKLWIYHHHNLSLKYLSPLKDRFPSPIFPKPPQISSNRLLPKPLYTHILPPISLITALGSY